MHIHPFTHWGKTKKNLGVILYSSGEQPLMLKEDICTDVVNASWSFSQQLTLYLQVLETQEASLINNQDRIG